MTPVEIILGAATALMGLFALIFGNGILKRHTDAAKEMAVQKHITDQVVIDLKKCIDEIKDLQSGSAVTKVKLDNFDLHIKKLDLIPDLHAKVVALEGVIADLRDTVQGLHRPLGHS